MAIVRVDEHSNSREMPLTDEQFIALRGIQKFIGIETGSKPGQYLLRSNQWVGTLKIEDLIVQIRPKIGAVNVLSMMLGGDGEARPQILRSLNRAKSDEIWDLVAELMLSSIYIISKQGLRREYKEDQLNSSFLRGEVRFHEDLVENIPVRNGIFCRFSELNVDISCNQELLWTLNALGFLAPKYSRRLHAAEHLFSGVSLPAGQTADLQRHSTGAYRLPLLLASMIRNSWQLIASTVGVGGSALMLDMNRVFEGFVRQKLRQTLGRHGIIVPEKSWASRSLCDVLNPITPDFVVSRNNETAAMLFDCKYKENWRFDRSDIFQMLAYFTCHEGSNAAIVLHPQTRQTLVEVDRTTLINGRLIVRIGLPAQALENDRTWADVEKIVLRVLQNEAVAA